MTSPDPRAAAERALDTWAELHNEIKAHRHRLNEIYLEFAAAEEMIEAHLSALVRDLEEDDPISA